MSDYADSYTFQKLVDVHESCMLYDASVRIKSLRLLRKQLTLKQKQIESALWEDLHKSPEQTRLTELLPVMQEIDYFLRHLKSLAKSQRVSANIAGLTAKTQVIPRPMGPSLIISPFNYPFQLAIAPYIGCLAAGCPCLICLPFSCKATKGVIRELLSGAGLLDKYCYVYMKEDYNFLPEKFACVFFTGSTRTGKHIYGMASQNLSRVILELGGANPLLVCDDMKGDSLVQCCKQIVMAKFMNAGQTCICPNYVAYAGTEQQYVGFIRELANQLKAHYGSGANHICAINTNKKYEELRNMLASLGKECKVTALLGSKLSSDLAEVLQYVDESKESKLFPLCLLEVTTTTDELYEEVFGPILLITRFNNTQSFLFTFKQRYPQLAKPLAAYIFTNNKYYEKEFRACVRAGCISINQALMHIVSNLPFGGFGDSGLYAYHGRRSFEFFTFMQPYLRQSYACHGRLFLKVQNKLALPPYTNMPLRFLNLLMCDAAVLWLLLVPVVIIAVIALAALLA